MINKEEKPNQEEKIKKNMINIATKQKSTLKINAPKHSVERSVLYEKLSKLGPIDALNYSPKSNTAIISFVNVSDAEKAKRTLNADRTIN